MRNAFLRSKLHVLDQLKRRQVHGLLYRALAGAYRLLPGAYVSSTLINALMFEPSKQRRLGYLKKALGDPELALGGTDDTVTLERAALIKPYLGPTERGIIVVSFESQLEKLLKLKSFSRLEKRYAIAFMPTWQPFYSRPLLKLVARVSGDFFLLPSSNNDLSRCSELGPHCVGLPFSAASWVPASFGPQTAVQARTIDFLMLANFSTYKRHWKLFEALASIQSSVNVVIAGRPLVNRTLQSLKAEANAFGVLDRLKFEVDPSDNRVAELLQTAKVVCALSQREGAYIAVAEAMMSGARVAMFSDAAIGTRDFLNQVTGVLLDQDQLLGPQLLRSLNVESHEAISDWARRNIAAEVSAASLNEKLHTRSQQTGMTWTQDITPFYCKNFRFHQTGAESSILHAERVSLAEEYGLNLPSMALTE
jgi:glycosyltransferase involved in cell wall biosynthesis